jgi:hypothetical protein
MQFQQRRYQKESKAHERGCYDFIPLYNTGIRPMMSVQKYCMVGRNHFAKALSPLCESSSKTLLSRLQLLMKNDNAQVVTPLFHIVLAP